MRRKTRKEYPFWVKMGLWGVPGRAGMWGFVWLSVVCAVACGVYGLWDPRFFFGLLFLVSGLMYWLTIRWVDKNGVWE